MPEPEFTISEIKGLVGEYIFFHRNRHLKWFNSAINQQNVYWSLCNTEMLLMQLVKCDYVKAQNVFYHFGEFVFAV